MKNITFEEKKKFLEGKLTEEEIGEVMRRLAEIEKNGVMPKKKDEVLQNVKASPVAEQRLQQQTSFFN